MTTHARSYISCYREGNLGDFLSAGSVYQYLTLLHQKYGEVVHYRIFNKHFVSTYTPEGYKDLIKLFNKPGIFNLQFICPIYSAYRKKYRIFLGKAGVVCFTKLSVSSFMFLESARFKFGYNFLNIFDSRIFHNWNHIR